LAFFTLVFVRFSTNNEQENTSLNTLSLERNNIGHTGATAVAEALKVSTASFTRDFGHFGQRALNNRALFHTRPRTFLHQ
jgi:hypothetical protein